MTRRCGATVDLILVPPVLEDHRPPGRHFVRELGMRLTSWQATTFLVGEFQLGETETPYGEPSSGLVRRSAAT